MLVPFQSSSGQIRSFRSIDGGASWRATVLVSTIQAHTVAGGLRTSPLPSAEIDAAGTVYVVWQDCRFRSGCAANDIVMSKSTSETTWGPVTRVPIDATSSTKVDPPRYLAAGATAYYGDDQRGWPLGRLTCTDSKMASPPFDCRRDNPTTRRPRAGNAWLPNSLGTIPNAH